MGGAFNIENKLSSLLAIIAGGFRDPAFGIYNKSQYYRHTTTNNTNMDT